MLNTGEAGTVSIEYKKDFWEQAAKRYKDYRQQWDILHEAYQNSCRIYEACVAKYRSVPESCDKEWTSWINQSHATIAAIETIASSNKPPENALSIWAGVLAQEPVVPRAVKGTTTSTPEEERPSPEENRLLARLKAADPGQRAQAAYDLGRFLERQGREGSERYFHQAASAAPENLTYLDRALFYSISLDRNGKFLGVDQQLLERALTLLRRPRHGPLLDEALLSGTLVFYYDRSDQAGPLSQELDQLNQLLWQIQGSPAIRAPSIAEAYRSIGSQSFASLAGLYNEVGVVRYRREQYEMAAADFKSAAALQGSFGEMDTDLARYLLNLARADWRLDLRNDAELYARQALLIYEQQLGMVNVETADVLWFLGTVCLTGSCDDHSYRDQALAVYRLTLPPDNPQWSDIYFEAAYLSESTRQVQEAYTFYGDALRAYEARFGRSSRELLPVLERYVHCLNEWGSPVNRLMNGDDAWMNAGGWTREYTKQLEARLELIRSLPDESR